jgi:hypothetical protein
MSIAAQVSELRERARMYATIGIVAKTEAAVADARRQKLTPLPKLSKDKETIAKIRSMRNKYESIVKCGKSLVSTCASKIKTIDASIQRVVKSAEKKPTRKTSAAPKKAKKSIAKRKARKPKRRSA